MNIFKNKPKNSNKYEVLTTIWRFEMYDKELRKFSIRTDLAIETNELIQQSGYVDGIITEIK